jgi:hypothetical protein
MSVMPMPPLGADQGRRHHPCSIVQWSHHHQDHPGRPAWATTATIRCAQSPKATSQSWAVGRAIRGHHSIHVAGLRRTPTTKEERGQPAVELLIQGTTGLAISDRPTTPYNRADPPSPTPDMENPNHNRLASSSLPQISPLGNQVICRVIRLPTST